MKQALEKPKKVKPLGRIEKIGDKYVFVMDVPVYKDPEYEPRFPYKD